MSRTTAVAVVVLLAAAAAAEPVRRDPPEWYGQVAPQLTPVEPLLAADVSALVDREVGGILLLDEEITYLLPSGESGLVVHRLARPLTEAGVEAAATTTFPFHRDLQTPVLVRARTIRPDGTSLEVAPEAAFVQTPQPLADSALYTDLAELRLVFPDVRPGHAVEAVVLMVQSRPRIPGELTEVTRLFAFWPVLRCTYVVDLPAAVAERLRVVAVGRDVPAAERSEPAPGRVRLTWAGHDVPRLRAEVGRQPALQGGPALLLSTLPSWDAFSRWYTSLLADRDEVPDDLAAAAAGWVGPDADRDEVLAALLAHVADDIRYTGLEFGLGRLQPRTPAEVWASRYGDCKDKANLLRVLLQRRGIAAHLALLASDHEGRVEEGAPTYHQFDHAIVAVEDGAGYRFCDPTARFLLPGQLPPHDTGRRALVIRGDRGEIVDIPVQSAGTVDLDLELTLGADRSLQGWLEITATGSNGAGWAESLLAQDPTDRNELLASMLESLLPGAELVDVEAADEVPRPGQGCSLRAYLAVPPSHREPSAAEVMALPRSGVSLPDLEQERERQTPYWQELETRSLRLTVQLPPGWSPSGPLPLSLAVDSPALAATGSWSADGGRLRGELVVTTRQPVIPPSGLQRLRQAIASITTWLATPVTLSPAVAGAGAAGASPAAPPPMPTMPSGEGQLRLVDFLYPADADPVARRQGLQQVLQLFPADIPTAFRAGVRLAVLDLAQDRAQEAADRLLALRQRHRAQVDASTWAWADHMYALCLEQLGRGEEARAVLEQLAADPAVPTERRCWVTSLLAEGEAESDPARAVARLRQGLGLDSDEVADLYSDLAWICAGQGWAEALRQPLEELAATDADRLAAVVGRLAEDATELLLDGEAERARFTVAVLESLSHDDRSRSALDEALAPVRDALDRRAAASRIAAAIAARLAADPPAWWAEAATGPDPATLAAADELVERLRTEGKLRPYLRASLETLARFAPEIEDFPDRLWRLAWTMDASSPNEPLLPSLVDWCELLPARDDGHWEGRFLRGKLLERQGEEEPAAALYRGMADDPELQPAYRVAAVIALAEQAERRGDLDAALVLYGSLEGRHEDNSRVCDALVRAVLLDLELGRADAALATLEALRKVPAEVRSQAPGATLAEPLLALTAEPAAARRYWAGQERWWPRWLELERLAAAPTPAAGVVVPFVPDLAELGRTMRDAADHGDRAGCFEAYRTLVHGCRWLPELLVEVSETTATLLRVAPELERPARAFAVALNTDPATDRPEIRERCLVQRAVHHFDGHEPTLTLADAREHSARFPKDTPTGRAMVRLRGLAAATTGEELAEARLDLERQLEQPELGVERGRAVVVLAQVLHRQGDVPAELALLRRELEDGPLVADDPRRTELTSRYRGLLSEGGGAAAFGPAVRAWLDRFQPPWFDFAHPATLSDPAIRDLEREAEGDAGTWSVPERFRLRMLVALDDAQPLPRREKAFVWGADLLVDLEHDRERSRAMLAAILGEPRLGHFVRSTALFLTLVEAAAACDPETFALGARSELVESLGGRFPELIATLEPVVAADRRDEESLATGVARLLARPVPDYAVAVLKGHVQRLGELGACERLAALAEPMAQAQLGDRSGETPLGLRLHLQRVRTACERDRGLYDHLRDALGRRVDLGALPRPAGWSATLDRDRLWARDEAEALELRLFLVGSQRLVADAELWAHVAHGLHQLRGDQELRQELLRTTLARAADDDQRLWVALSLADAYDLDVDADTEELTALLAPYRDPVTYPSTSTLVRLHELDQAVRRGQRVDLEGTLSALHHPLASWLAPSALVKDAMSRDDLELLRRRLRALSPEQLVQPLSLAANLRALRRAGLEAEAGLVAEAAEKELYRATLASWARLDRSSLWRVFALAEVLHGAPAYPAAWLQHVRSAVRDRKALLSFDLADAELRGDWAAAVTAARALLEAEPTAHDLRFRLGRALVRVGSPAAAVEPLEVFLAHRRDSPDVPEARRLLAEALGPATPAPAGLP